MKRIIALFILVFLISGCSGNSGTRKYQKLEKKFADMAEKYYNEVGKNKIIGVDKYTIYISTLTNAGYDTGDLVDPKTGDACDNESSATIVIQENGQDYTTEVSLICGSYKTEKK